MTRGSPVFCRVWARPPATASHNALMVALPSANARRATFHAGPTCLHWSQRPPHVRGSHSWSLRWVVTHTWPRKPNASSATEVLPTERCLPRRQRGTITVGTSLSSYSRWALDNILLVITQKISLTGVAYLELRQILVICLEDK